MPTKKVAKRSARRPARRPEPRRKGVGASISRTGALRVEIEPRIVARLVGPLERWEWYLRGLEPRLQIICLVPVSGPDAQPVLRRSVADGIAWKNHTKSTIHISFIGACPLKGFPTQGIDLRPGKNTALYVVDPQASLEKVTYKLDPPFEGRPGEGPDEPVIIVET